MYGLPWNAGHPKWFKCISASHLKQKSVISTPLVSPNAIAKPMIFKQVSNTTSVFHGLEMTHFTFKHISKMQISDSEFWLEEPQ